MRALESNLITHNAKVKGSIKEQKVKRQTIIDINKVSLMEETCFQ